jgi:hypothetical protein
MKRRFRAAIALVPLVAALMSAAPARALSDGWSTHGPYGASVSELVIDPQDPATVYAATQTGIFKTSDGAQSWHRLSGFPGERVAALAISPSDPNVLYAAEIVPEGPTSFRCTGASTPGRRGSA